MSKEEPKPSCFCTSAKCQRVPYKDGECWLCPDCKEKLEFRLQRAESKMMDLEIAVEVWKRQAIDLLEKYEPHRIRRTS